MVYTVLMLSCSLITKGSSSSSSPPPLLPPPPPSSSSQNKNKSVDHDDKPIVLFSFRHQQLAATAPSCKGEMRCVSTLLLLLLFGCFVGHRSCSRSNFSPLSLSVSQRVHFAEYKWRWMGEWIKLPPSIRPYVSPSNVQRNTSFTQTHDTIQRNVCVYVCV